MDTALLLTFREVVRQGGITVAAEVLGYTQSAVSRQIAALETAFGTRLFDRRGRGVELTEQGRALVPHADAVIARLSAARRELEAVDRGEAGRLRVGAFPTAAAALVPDAIAAFTAAHPAVEISLVEGITRRLVASIRAGDVDIAVVSAFPEQAVPAEVELVAVLDDPLLVALPRAHRLGRRRTLRLRELARETWIGPDARDDDRLLGPARLPGDETPTAFAVRDWAAKLGLVAAGLGITLVPTLAARATRADVALVAIDHEDLPPRQVLAATRAGASPPPTVGAFMEVLREAAAGIR